MAENSRAGTTGEQCILTISAGAHDTPAVIAMETYNGDGDLETNYLWFDSDGLLRVAQTLPEDQDADGGLVGEQGS